jgi:uncharacterized membrane protein YciS (DUF1049 family)
MLIRCAAKCHGRNHQQCRKAFEEVRMPGLNEVLAKAGQQMAAEGATKVVEPFVVAMFAGTAATAMGSMLVGIVIKEAIGLIVGPMLVAVFAVSDQLASRVKTLERRVDQIERQLDDRPLQAQELLVRKIDQLADVTGPTVPEQIQYLRAQIAIAALQLEQEMVNAQRLGDLNRFRSDLLLGIAASVQPGGASAARRHLQLCLDQVNGIVASHKAELANALDERKRPPPRKTRREEVIRHVRGMEIGTSLYREVDDGPGHYSHRPPARVQTSIDDVSRVEKSLQTLLDGLASSPA